MDAMNVLENSYYVINKNFNFYKRNFGHIYYLNVQDDETKFIGKRGELLMRFFEMGGRT